MRVPRIELGSIPWQGTILPLDHTQGAPTIVPWPQSITYGSGSIDINPLEFTITTNIQSFLLDIAVKRYQQQLFFAFGPGAQSGAEQSTLNIQVASSSEDLYLGVDESYSIDASSVALFISSQTIYGAMRALETFSQLIVYNQFNDSYTLPFLPVAINDYPRYEWRGFLFDAARHYSTVPFILHVIDSLAYNKFNVFHWHLSDNPSFAFKSERYPKLNDASYSPRAVYTKDDINEVVAYGKSYGIRVIGEFDVPALPETYEFIENLFKEGVSLFPDQYFHVGGDEAPLVCWSEDPRVNAWMTEKGYNLSQAEQYFEDKIDEILARLGKTKVIWEDPVVNNVTLPKDTIVEVWGYGDTQKILNANHRVLTAYSWYLDQQIPDSTLVGEFQDTWTSFYKYDPTDGVTSNEHLIIGGEGQAWAEQVNQLCFDTRVWPRNIAIAERLWSNRAVNSTSEALPRIQQFSCHIERRGVLSGPLFPSYCNLPAQRPNSQSPLFRFDLETINSINNK
eukprot:gene15530-18448_t